MKVYKRDQVIWFEDGLEKFYANKNNVQYEPLQSDKIIFVVKDYPGTLKHPSGQTLRLTYSFNEITNRAGAVYGDNVEDIIDGINAGQDVNIQDQHTDAIIVKFNQVQESTTISIDGAIDDTTITLTSTTGTADGKYIILFHPASERFTTFIQVGATVGSVITLDSPLDFAYPSGTFVDIANTDMAVDGSVTPQTFGLRGTGAPPGVDISFDMTRIMLTCLTASAVDLSLFGDLAALTNGLVLRTRNGRTHNLFNVKTNRDIDAIFGTDWKPYASTNPIQGQDGFTARLTFASQGKIGVTIRLPIGEDVEFIVQDALQSITILEGYAEGHIVEK